MNSISMKVIRLEAAESESRYDAEKGRSVAGAERVLVTLRDSAGQEIRQVIRADEAPRIGAGYTVRFEAIAGDGSSAA